MVVKDVPAKHTALKGFITISLFFCVSSVTLISPAKSFPEVLDFQSFLGQLNLTRIQQHLRFFSEQPSRFTGSPGYLASAHYIKDKFISYGFENVTPDYYHRYNVTVPTYLEAGFQILSLPNESFRIHAMEPNLVVPVTTPGIVGPILYVGDGTLEDFSRLNKTVEGSIILMNFNTFQNWLNAAKLGAKAVIFIEPRTTTYRECRAKSLDIPFNYLRFYMPLKSATRLINMIESSQDPLKARLSANTTWETVEGLNVLGLLRGKSYPDQIIIVSAHYDSDSVAPAAAPGANQAVGVAVFLEMARLMSMNPPKCSVLFAALSGHNQGLAGSRYFVEDFFFEGVRGDKTQYVTNIGNKVILQVDLHLSTKSSEAVRTVMGDFYMSRMEYYIAGFGPFAGLNNYVGSLVEEMNKQLGKQYVLYSAMGPLAGRDLRKYFPLGMRPYDFEPYMYCLGACFSLVTIDYDDYGLSPLDTYERLSMENLRVQAELSTGVVYGLASTDNLKGNYLAGFGAPRRFLYRDSGQVGIYQEDIAWYRGVPKALVHVVALGGENSRGFVVQADEEGKFLVPGWGSGSGGAGGPFMLRAFKLNDTSGDIIYAPDLGIHKWASMSQNIQGVDANIGFLAVFKCATAVLFDIIYPSKAGTARVPCDIKVLSHGTHAPPEYFSHLMITKDPLAISVAVAFVEPEKPVEFLLTAVHLGRMPMGFLLNSTDDRPEGYGYELKAGEQYVLHNTPLKVAEDMYRLNSFYAITPLQYGIAGDLLERNEEVGQLVQKGKEALTNNRYNGAYAISITAWAKALEAYIRLRGTIEDTSSTIVFFGLIIIPFSILFESFFVGSKGRKKIFTTLSVFIIFLIIFSILHPAFQLTADPTMIIIGFAVMILSTPVTAILFSSFLTFLKRTEVKVKGVHFAEVGRGAAFMLAFSVGMENVKKRRFRAALTLITIILIVVGLVLFTSLSALYMSKPKSIGLRPSYQGIYIRDHDWYSIGQKILDVLKTQFSDKAATIVPRSWLYTIDSADTTRTVLFTIEFNGNRARYYAAMGLTPEEKMIGWVDIALREGRWFTLTDVETCILADSLARELRVNVGDRVNTLGMELTVVGVVNSDYMDKSLTDLDGEQVTTWDNSVPDQTWVHKPIRECIVVPYNLLMQFAPTTWGERTTSGGAHGFVVSSLSIVTTDESTSRSIAEWIFNVFGDLYMYVGAGNDTLLYTKGIVYTVFGLQMQIVPMILCIFIILNITLASVEERSREIFTYASVGMSPLQVSFMFLAEASIYALVGSILGFVIAMGLSLLISHTHILMVATNYSSGWVITPLGLVMLFTLLSTIFAMRKASKLVTPSLERVWRVPTKPVRDEWTVPLPFIISDEKEASGVMAYLTEFIELHTGEAEVFSAAELSHVDEQNRKILGMDARLAPYEQGVIQRADIICIKNEETGYWGIEIFLRRTGGSRNLWVRLNRQLIDAVRKQLLLWRSLSPEERRKYE